MSVILALGRYRLEDGKFKVILGYVVSLRATRLFEIMFQRKTK